MSTGLRFTLEVDGLPPDAFAVVSFHLNQSLSSLFSLDLSLVSQQFLSLEFAQVLDKMAYLTIWQGDGRSTGICCRKSVPNNPGCCGKEPW